MASTLGLLEPPGAARPADTAATLVTTNHSAATSEAEGSPVPHARSGVKKPRFRKMVGK